MGPTGILLGHRRRQEISNIKGCSGARFRWKHWPCLDLPPGTCWDEGAEWFSLCAARSCRSDLAVWLCQDLLQWMQRGDPPWGREGQTQMGWVDKPWFNLLNSGTWALPGTWAALMLPSALLHLCGQRALWGTWIQIKKQLVGYGLTKTDV